MKRSRVKTMADANMVAGKLERRSEVLLNEAYLTLVRAAKANGISVKELIEQRKKVAKKRLAKK